jgi:hypothetical protein
MHNGARCNDCGGGWPSVGREAGEQRRGIDLGARIGRIDRSLFRQLALGAVPVVLFSVLGGAVGLPEGIGAVADTVFGRGGVVKILSRCEEVNLVA